MAQVLNPYDVVRVRRVPSDIGQDSDCLVVNAAMSGEGGFVMELLSVGRSKSFDKAAHARIPVKK